MSGAGEQAQAQAQAEPEAPLELVLFQVAECYVYLIPPRKTAASYRADEWNVNKWAWEGTLKVISKGEECIIRLEDKNSGELYARAFLREGEPHPVEPVIDSSRYFVLRVEENIDGRQRHAFIGLGFRERHEAYDFQAALHDHMKYLNKKKTAEEMVQHYEKASSVDYSLKEGETLVLQLKNKESGTNIKSAFFEQGLNKLSFNEKTNSKDAPVSLKLPPPPPSPVSPTDSGIAASPFKAEFPSQDQPASDTGVDTTPFKVEFPSQEQPAADTVVSSPPPKAEVAPQDQPASTEKATQESVDDDFGDFQAAG
uniref:NECAP PHear domain-containing protein n=1 Tax=Leersia perrieri TaxID=77586 RepID=A0A0D9V2W3_9ORYZ